MASITSELNRLSAALTYPSSSFSSSGQSTARIALSFNRNVMKGRYDTSLVRACPSFWAISLVVKYGDPNCWTRTLYPTDFSSNY